MAKVTVKVCTGTTCFIMGGEDLHRLIEIIPQKYGDQVEITAVNCLGLCSLNWENPRAPYAKVNEEPVFEATVEKVLEEVDRQLA